MASSFSEYNFETVRSGEGVERVYYANISGFDPQNREEDSEEIEDAIQQFSESYWDWGFMIIGNGPTIAVPYSEENLEALKSYETELLSIYRA
ncbi:MAG: hypothetical protein KDD68_20685 [Bdellovibrionales bacterium]|nr:hypothetical protein [Bdellovibrionales bacterium]